MNTDFFLDEDLYTIALWCRAGAEPTDLAYAAECAIEHELDVISVVPEAVSILWPWLETEPVKILARFYLDDFIDSDSMSEFTANVNTVLKQGADGIQVFIRYKDLETFVEQIYSIRDDLFFNKELFIGIDINDINPFDWENVLEALNKIHATGLILVLPKDKGDKSDYVGRLYAALEAWKNDFNLYFFLGDNLLRIEQTKRLIKSMQPNLLDRVKFFINV